MTLCFDEMFYLWRSVTRIDLLAYNEQPSNDNVYRQFVRWCYDYLGKKIRVPIPSETHGIIPCERSKNKWRGYDVVYKRAHLRIYGFIPVERMQFKTFTSNFGLVKNYS